MKALTCKRGISLMMALVLCLAGILGIGTTTAYAAGEQAEVYQIAFPRDGDANYHSEWGHPALQFMNGWSTGDTDQTSVRAMHSYRRRNLLLHRSRRWPVHRRCVHQ